MMHVHTSKPMAALICAIALQFGPTLQAAAQQAAAQQAPHATPSQPTRMTPAEFTWPAAAGQQAGSSMQSAVQSTVVFGNASGNGLYSIVFKVAPNARIPAHSHPDDRSCFVTNGIWYFGYGDRYDETALRALPAGSHYTEPANVSHFAGTKGEGATAECTAIGPSGTAFTHPEDDPRR